MGYLDNCILLFFFASNMTTIRRKYSIFVLEVPWNRCQFSFLCHINRNEWKWGGRPKEPNAAFIAVRFSVYRRGENWLVVFNGIWGVSCTHSILIRFLLRSLSRAELQLKVALPMGGKASQDTAHTPPESRRKTGRKKLQCLPEPWHFKADRYHLLQAY